ncbi:hypothetical protein FO519_008189 [Halicephalobus sp. NKZ332]|nr:hypothetical protein FO519_008189 [Halicephalobus sp. NKZ332]
MNKLFRRAPRELTVIVKVADGSKTLPIKSSTTGQELMDQLAENYNIEASTSLFGFRYTNSKGKDSWIKLQKKITSHDIKKEDVINLKLCVKYYPTNFEKELKGETAKYIFCYYINTQIQSNDLYTPMSYYIVLTSLALQAESGDYSDTYPGSHSQENNDRLRSKALVFRAEGYNMPLEQLQQDVIDCWKLHRGKSREDVSVNFLKIAKELDSYGITYFDFKTPRGTEIHIGINNEGITIYEHGKKLTPKIGFVWNDITKVLYSGMNFIVKLMNSKTENIAATVLDSKAAKPIFGLCMGNHELYLRRQKLSNSLDSTNDEVADKILKSKIESLSKLFPVNQSTRAEDREYAENQCIGRNQLIMMQQARSGSIEARVKQFKEL